MDGEKLGTGFDVVRQKLKEDKKLRGEIEKKILAKIQTGVELHPALGEGATEEE